MSPIKSHLYAGAEEKINDLSIIRAAYYDDLIGPGEVRQLAGDLRAQAVSSWVKGTGPVSSRTLAVWRAEPDLEFPAPVRELSIGPVWDRRHVAAWLERRYG